MQTGQVRFLDLMGMIKAFQFQIQTATSMDLRRLCVPILTMHDLQVCGRTTEGKAGLVA